MEVFKTYKVFTWLSIDKMYERDANIKGTRGIHWDWKRNSVREVRRYFFHVVLWTDGRD